MPTFAIIETGGKQYRVSAGTKVKVERLDVQPGESVSFDKVLLRVDGEKVKIGTPYISGASVAAKVSREGRDRKVIVFKYHSKTRQRKKKGHRQPFTEVEVVSI
ncbi:MAG: 50S ribosomal protein L21 [Candidatus Liptonbacteria bacterium RIFCSPLOWO2_01_FULL_52_25]|uniref:Large ribosomal subunit protein bL21 n=1 Tax=Candidatus Liptonbacteria bacterium RIFCSPLOWO2_01_FULL_52_25 TaxID=1798650 RepID=A0A1G2CDI2_9BACT|nr:MAG: 50S ribosomal protein L21 [Candidatus Liptonbacteria bacterium RIFCSPLOWO2_01_FULL_52_25]